MQSKTVDRGTEPAVQADLLGAEVASAFHRAEIEERETDRLLELVGVGAREEDVRDVRLQVLDGPRPVRIEAGVGERRDHRLLRHDRARTVSTGTEA